MMSMQKFGRGALGGSETSEQFQRFSRPHLRNLGFEAVEEFSAAPALFLPAARSGVA